MNHGKIGLVSGEDFPINQSIDCWNKPSGAILFWKMVGAMGTCWKMIADPKRNFPQRCGRWMNMGKVVGNMIHKWLVVHIYFQLQEKTRQDQ